MKKARDGRHPAGEGTDAFRDAMRDVQPLRATNRVPPAQPRPPRAARAVVAQAPSIPLEDDSAFLRPGLPRTILRELRRSDAHEELDLHGFTLEEAVRALDRFIVAARRRGARCVRVIHGKGLRSAGGEPVLKGDIRHRLASRADVLAFVEPPAASGGAGAVVVLLDG